MHNKKILLTGSCWFEIAGLWYLLSEKGYKVTRAPMDSCTKNTFDLTIIALSAEKIPGWGRHISAIREMRKRISGEMIVLVPHRLEHLTLLQDVCCIYNGYKNVETLGEFICEQLYTDFFSLKKIKITKGQRQIIDLTLGVSQICYDQRLYYHQIRLAKNVGVRNLRLLIMAGLTKDPYLLNL
ncbi:hypothetical protein ABLI14_003754 [Escherichia coli]|nr:hypothetical protein [Escherichia coli]EJE8511728.1 hypothetical protein [Shigella sonnei]ELO0577281.1 hypothetical protein [Escherichia coli O2]EES9724454.1 hypothetical protein [Escherichia coli]EFI8247331.1 hypothetical protein [Escherichia coli]